MVVSVGAIETNIENYGNTREEREKATAKVHLWAKDADDEHMLLQALGLIRTPEADAKRAYRAKHNYKRTKLPRHVRETGTDGDEDEPREGPGVGQAPA